MAVTLSCFAAEVPSDDMVAPPRTSDFSLRRAAILLSNLDAESRRRLLSHLSPRDAASLRAATASLADVDPLEVRRTVSAFVGRISSAREELSDATAARSAESARRGASVKTPAGGGGDDSSTTASKGALQFLHNVPDATLLRAVQSEHPQTIAVVLASIDPKQAARLLRRLEPQQRGEAIRRLGRLDDVPQDAIDDIGRHLRDLIGAVGELGSGEGRRKLASIFSEFGAEDRQWFDQTIGASDGVVAAVWAEAERAFPAAAEADASAGAADASSGAAEGDADDSDPPRILPMDRHSVVRLSGMENGAGGNTQVDRSGPAGAESPRRSISDASDRSYAASVRQGETSESPAPAISGDQADAVLEQLKPVQLRAVLAELPARESLLTVCGLSPRCVRRLLRAMPRRHAKEVRRRLDSLGPLELREIEQAKRAAATVALGTTPRAADASAMRAA